MLDMMHGGGHQHFWWANACIQSDWINMARIINVHYTSMDLQVYDDD